MTNTNFIDVLPKANAKGALLNPIDHIDVRVIIAVREHARAVSLGHISEQNELEVGIMSLAPKAFDTHFSTSNGARIVPLSKYGEKSQFLCKQTQLFKPSTTPVVHPSHVYTAIVALEVRRRIVIDQVTLSSGNKLTADALALSMAAARNSVIAESLNENDLTTQLDRMLDAPIDPDSKPTVTLDPKPLVAFQQDVMERHKRELAGLPANILDPDKWLADWFAALVPAFPASASWLGKALMWRDMACKEREPA